MITLDRQIVMNKKTSSIDEFGGKVEVNQTLPMFANIDFSKGRESEAEGVEYTDNKIVVTIHYRDWITTKNDFTFKGRLYDIESVNELQRNKYLQLIAVAHE